MIPVGFRIAGLAGRRPLATLLVVASAMLLPRASASSTRALGYEYLSPLPGARLVSPWNNVVLRPGAVVDAATVTVSALSVTGSRSGRHPGRLELSDDRRTLVFTSDLPFAEGESVTVTLAPGIRTRDGAPLPTVSFGFAITPRDPKRAPMLIADESTGRLVRIDRQPSPTTGGFEPQPSRLAASSDTLPPGMTKVSLISSNQPDSGDVFVAPFTGFASGGNLMIIDNTAHPLFYRKLKAPAFDFKRQPNGLLTYFSGVGTYWALDSSYAVVDSFQAGNGYTADLHDLQLLPNGHALLMIYDEQPVPMDTVVSGGRPEAKVIGLVIQELDQAKNVVFQWRSWDHFLITDADTCMVSMRDTLVDYVHGNAVELDTDGNLLVSCRSMHEVTKIDHETGDIIWRWGMYSKNNQFTFVNDSRGFAAQHDVRRLPNGDVTLFDNGNCMAPPTSSRGVEYQLDEVNKVATLVWEFPTDMFTPFMGNVQRRGDGGTMIGWGGRVPDPKLTDLHPDGSVALAIALDSPMTWTYRAFRFPWQTSRFAVMADTVDFGAVDIASSAMRWFPIWNRSAAPVKITSIVGHAGAFSVMSPLPLIIAPGETDSVQVSFVPNDLGTYCDTLYVRSVSSTELVAQPLTVFGTCYANGIWIEDVTQFEGHSYRSPFRFKLRIPAPRTKYVSVQYQVTDGTATVANSDYEPSAARVFFAPGDTVTWIWVYVRGDHNVEPDETFTVTLSNPMNAVIDRAQAVGTILDDDRLADVDGATPLEFALFPASPNPGRVMATIRYDLARDCNVQLEVFDLTGRRIESLVDRQLPAGHHVATWSPKSGTTGVFFYRLRAADFVATRKLILVR